jgi:hypothetical protein
MAHRNEQFFVLFSARLKKVRCKFCNLMCDFSSASRHQRDCRQYNRYISKIRKDALKNKRLKRLQKNLDIDTNVPLIVEKARAATKVGRYGMTQSDIAESDAQGVNRLIRSIFERTMKELPGLIKYAMSFLPISYVDDVADRTESVDSSKKL